MVQLEEVEDQDLVREQPGPYQEDEDDDYTDTGKFPPQLLNSFPPRKNHNTFSATYHPSERLYEKKQRLIPSNVGEIIDSSLSDDDLTSALAPSETALDRIYALKDMVSPSTRRSIAATSSNVFTAYVRPCYPNRGKTHIKPSIAVPPVHIPLALFSLLLFGLDWKADAVAPAA